ncbi:MAG: ABC transporter ATP-binding protein [Anaerorhabdus sp.]
MSKKIEEKQYEFDSFDLSLWKKILSHMQSQKINMIFLFISTVTISIVSVLFPYLTKLAIDTFVIAGRSAVELTSYLILFIMLIVLQSLGAYGFFIFSGRVEMGVAYELRKKTFQKLQTLSFSFFDRTSVGWLIARVTSDITRLSEILSWAFMDMVTSVIEILGAIMVMFFVNWKLSLWAVAIFPIIVMTSLWFQTRVLKNSREVRKLNSKITSSFNEGISGAQVSKSLMVESAMYREFHQESADLKLSSIKSLTLSALFSPVLIFLTSLILAGVLITGGNLVLLQEIQLGTIVMFFQYATMMFMPIKIISTVLAELQVAQSNGERILDLLDTEPDIQDSAEVIEKYGTILEPKVDAYEEIKGDVEFRHVDFYYNPEEPVLKDFNLKVSSGDSVALVGETGSGKSTIVNLLCRFYEPVNGEILIDGVNYRERSIGWLHSNLGYVLQSPHLFSGTIMENLKFGNHQLTQEAIENACRLVHAHEFISNLENGYQTEVGEGGSSLSTGQKQLISFARALLANPAILVLDEATSSVDTETEQVIQAALNTVLANRTSFIIAHRLSTVVNASIILVIDKGSVVESGTHAELIAKKQRYYKLYMNQFNDELEKKLLKKE